MKKEDRNYSKEGKIMWRFPISKVSSFPVIDTNNTVYITKEQKIIAIDSNGHKKWEFLTGDILYSAPAIGKNNTIYFGSKDKNLYALNPNGTEKWSFTTSNPIKLSPAIGEKDIIYLVSGNKILYALNPDGSKKWSFTTLESILTSPSIGNDGVIYLGTKRYLYAINPDGSKKWSFSIGWINYKFPIIDKEGMIYFLTKNNQLHSITSNGTEKWSFCLNGEAVSSPIIGKDNTIYILTFYEKSHPYDDTIDAVYTHNYDLFAINPNGTKKWSRNIDELDYYDAIIKPEISKSSPFILNDENIYCLIDHKTYKVDPTGRAMKKFEDNSEKTPVIDKNGKVYKISIGSLRKYDKKCGFIDSPWPRIGKNIRNTNSYNDNY
jgi:outer membrane protein assembly factor BamB